MSLCSANIMWSFTLLVHVTIGLGTCISTVGVLYEHVHVLVLEYVYTLTPSYLVRN